MASSDVRAWRLPREEDLGLLRIANELGLEVSVLPNGSVFAIEHRTGAEKVLVNQVLASPLAGGISRILLRRTDGRRSATRELLGPHARARVGTSADRVVWEGAAGGLHHQVALRLLADKHAWLWRVEVTNASRTSISVDAIFLQDLGLGDRAFVTNNEAYASQYIDHHVANDPLRGPVIMSRQNLSQRGNHPWVMHGCLEGARGFATDTLQLFGATHRDADDLRLPFGTRLANRRLQHEGACAAIQSGVMTLEPGTSTCWHFFALYEPDHPAASHDGDLAKLDGIVWRMNEPAAIATTHKARRSVAQRASSARVLSFTAEELARRYPKRFLQEFSGRRLLSFFTPDGPHNRHVVLRAKERIVTRPHGALLRSGRAMLPDEKTLCATCWMQGIFAAQLTVGNTSFHKLFSVSRDPYNISRTSGLRVLIDRGNGWRLLTVPTAFEMGLSDCRWVYALSDRLVTVRAMASGEDPAMHWRISIEGEPCRLLVLGHLVLGEREFEHAGSVRADSVARCFTFRPDPQSLWGQHYPGAVYHLVTSTPDIVESIGGDELLYENGDTPRTTHVAIVTLPAREFCFAVVGSLTDPAEAERLAREYARVRDDDELQSAASVFWTSVTRGSRIVGRAADTDALNASIPWLAHDAMIHLTVPRGLEQYTGAAWGTRDVCQGPVEFLLALKHDEPVKQILRIVFAQQYEMRGDWPQWFMLEPYSFIRDRHSHGDVIVWPLKALNDYVEATNDLAFLEEQAGWCNDETLAATARNDSIASHVEKLIATVRERFVPGTQLVRYGEGDWNDSLQPADPALRDAMVSSWTVALLYQQLVRYAEVLQRAGRSEDTRAFRDLAAAMREDFNRFLIRDGTVAGYGVFQPGKDAPELLLHPSDVRTGLSYSLLPMTRSIIAGLFTAEQARHHLRIIREHLLFPDGARLMDRPVTYRGGLERTFRRAETASFFGREIGLMYVHAHLRYAEAMAVLGEADALWDALHAVNPISVTDRVPNATPRQRNAYFSSSDAAFADRYAASAEWARVKAGTIGVEGGWRIYSSGPGLYVNVLIRHALGIRRFFGASVEEPLLPESVKALRFAFD